MYHCEYIYHGEERGQACATTSKTSTKPGWQTCRLWIKLYRMAGKEADELLEELHRDYDGRRCVMLRQRRTKV